MLRQAHHERRVHEKQITQPFVLSLSKGGRPIAAQPPRGGEVLVQNGEDKKREHQRRLKIIIEPVSDSLGKRLRSLPDGVDLVVLSGNDTRIRPVPFPLQEVSFHPQDFSILFL